MEICLFTVVIPSIRPVPFPSRFAIIRGMSDFSIRPIQPADRVWVAELARQQWGSNLSVSRGAAYEVDQLPGFIACQGEQPVGLATYHIRGEQCELVTIDSLLEGVGIGTSLIAAVRQAALSASCRRLWLITTNDNLHALHFYQKRGFYLAALYPNAIAQSRAIKPEIPITGLDGILIRDEIELEQWLDPEESPREQP
jgi:DNA-3-methyladenine glycosylase I